MNMKFLVLCVLLIAFGVSMGCKKSDTNGTDDNSKSAGATVAGGVEKVKPAAGKGNVQGKVLYNSKPAQGIHVKLCEHFSQYLGGCSGQTYTSTTDASGEFVITDVPPGKYEGLTAQVFDTDGYIFMTTGIGGLSSATYEITADKTLFVKPTNLFKSDLKVLNPKAGSTVSGQNLELKWQDYPDAAYYKFSLFPEQASITAPYVSERVDGTAFAVNKPLEKGTYRWQVQAYNSSDIKLAEDSDDIKFTVQ
jgi:hypothetical protein